MKYADRVLICHLVNLFYYNAERNSSETPPTLGHCRWRGIGYSGRRKCVGAAGVNALDHIELIGEVRNTGDAALEYVEVIGTFYGTDSSIVEVASTYLDLDVVEPGQAAPFKMLPGIPGADVTEYKLQVKP